MDKRKRLPQGFSRRRFLELGVLSIPLLGSLAGCAEDEFQVTPQTGWKLWIAEVVYGRVIRFGTSFNVPYADVKFFAGLNRESLFELARTRADSEGKYEIKAAPPSADAGFFRFILPDDQVIDRTKDVPVYCRLTATSEGVGGEFKFKLLRRPLRSVPGPLTVQRDAVIGGSGGTWT